MPSGEARACVSDETLAALLERRLDASTAKAVAEHIDRCEDCRRVVAEAAQSQDPAGPEPPGVDEAAPVRASALRSGALVGRYVVLECIGAGSMGIVYTARDPDLGRSVALKLLRPDPAAIAYQGGRARLLREAQAMARLSHPNVITIYDVGTVGDEVFLAMELVQGGTLTEWARATRRGWREIFDVLVAAGEGLAAAHDVGLVHRDFKPDNVLVGDDGRVRVTDFGLARSAGERPDAEGQPKTPPADHLLASMTRTGTLIGTPAYMAPEQLAGEVADARSDLFAFSATFYETLYGERPFSGSTFDELSERVAAGAIRPAPADTHVPAWLRRTILGGLRADPSQRPASVRAMLGALRSGIARRRRRVVLVSAALAIAGVAAVAASLRSARGHGTDTPINAASAAPQPTAMTDVPLPSSTSAEALRAYESGLRRLRGGNFLNSATDFQRAAELDPGLGAAHLRFALVDFWYHPFEARAHLAQAADDPRRLSERDQLLLVAAQAWMQSQPADGEAYARRMAEARQRFPLDSEVAYWSAKSEYAKGDRKQALAMDDRALELDPQMGPAYYDKIEEFLAGGDSKDALAAADACAANLQNPLPCLLERNSIDQIEGNCGRIEETTRQLVAREPAYHPLYWYLANAAYSLGRPSDEVGAFLVQEVGKAPAELQPGFEFVGFGALEVLAGDFDALLRRARAFEQRIASYSDARWHETAALWHASAAMECGRTDEASAVVKEFFRRKDAWLAEPRTDDLAIARDASPALLAVGRRVGWLRPADFEARRKAWADAWAARVPKEFLPFVWLQGYADIAENADDAARALQELPTYGPPPEYTYFVLGDASLGATYFLAGEIDDALPRLRRAERSCRAVEAPFAHTRANLWLGRALASIGARDEACTAYAVVLARWGSARPRSMTADAARSEAGALGCPSSPP
jgi:serine/threonine-protein kinase